MTLGGTLKEIRDFFLFEAPFGSAVVAKDLAGLFGTVALRQDSLLPLARMLRRRRRKAKATFFFVAKNLSRWEREIRSLQRAGHEIGCHGYEHVLFSRLTEGSLERQFFLCGSAFERIGIRPAGFRPPYLDTSRRTEEACKKAGYSYVSCRRSWKLLPNVFVRRPYDWERLVAGETIPVTSPRSAFLFHPRLVARHPELLENALAENEFRHTLRQLAGRPEGTGLSFDVY